VELVTANLCGDDVFRPQAEYLEHVEGAYYGRKIQALDFRSPCFRSWTSKSLAQEKKRIRAGELPRLSLPRGILAAAGDERV